MLDDGVCRSARPPPCASPERGDVGAANSAARRTCDAAQHSVDALYPLVLAKFSAESPLARHSRMRSTHFASVSFVMRPSLPTNRTPRKNASLCSGYVLSTWERVRYFLDALGPWKGRLLAEYPRRWQRAVYQSLRCEGVERARVEERLRRLDPRVFTRREGAAYDGTKAWLENAVAEHARLPFRAIIASETGGKDFVLDGAHVDDASLLWKVDKGKLVPRDPAVFAQALNLLLRVSSPVVIVDPYFRADQAEKAGALRALCGALPREAQVEVHFADKHVSYAFGMDHAQRALPGVVPHGRTVSLHCWIERPGTRLHNRFVLTEIGGVQFGDGIEQGNSTEHDRISILEEASRERLWNDVVGSPPSFDSAGPVREFTGGRRHA